MDVELPDGTVIQGVPEGTTKAQLAEKLKANGHDVPESWLPQKRRSPLEAIGRQVGLTARGAIEGAASLPLAITDAPTTIKRGFGGKTGLKASEVLHNVLTKVGLPEPETGTERVVQDIVGGMSGTGAVAKGATGAVKLSEIAKGGASGGMAGGAREAGAPDWAQTLIGAVPLGIPGKVGLKPPKPEMMAHEEIISKARSEGYKLPPQSMVGKALTTVAGKGPTKAALTIENQEITNKIARREAGLGEKTPITDENLAAAREEMSGPYKEVAEVSPKAKSALKSLKQTRVDARNQWRFYNSYGSQGYANPAVKKQAEALDRKADFYDSIIENEAVKIAQEQMKLAKPRGTGGKFISSMEEGKKLGQSLVDDLRDARVKLAKNYQIDRANTPGGDIDAKAIARDKGKKTDGIKLISDFEIERRPHFGVEMQLEPDVHMAGGLGLHHLGGWGYLGAGIPGLRGLARKGALSRIGQGPKSNAQMGIPLSALTNYLGQRSEQEE